jgi:tRNA threonylcarbamoyladenosine biosynthesis protein TsaE
MQRHLHSAEETEQFGAELWSSLPPQALVFLQGDLGAGKTTLVRACLRAAGFLGTVKSPTYTLVEEYPINGRMIYHFDLYRLADPEELEWMGIRDYFTQKSLCFIEWPDKGKGFLPPPDLTITLSVAGDGRILTLQP